MRYVTFLYTKIQILRRKQENLRYVYIYTKILTLGVTRFITEFLKLVEERGEERNFYEKKMHFALNFNKKKALSVTFLFTKSATLCVAFSYAKTNAICVTFYI